MVIIVITTVCHYIYRIQFLYHHHYFRVCCVRRYKGSSKKFGISQHVVPYPPDPDQVEYIDCNFSCYKEPGCGAQSSRS